MQIKKYPCKNLNRNRTLYFQIGLCLVLIFSLISIEWKNYSKSYKHETVQPSADMIDEAYVVKIPEKKLNPIEKKVKLKSTSILLLIMKS